MAFLNKNDTYHGWAREQFARVPGPYFACEAVVTEACYLVGRASVGPAAILELVARGVLKLDFSLGGEIETVRRLMARYADAGISLADACLVRMSELHPRCQVMTTDRDFVVYRRDGRRAIPLLAPFG